MLTQSTHHLQGIQNQVYVPSPKSLGTSYAKPLGSAVEGKQVDIPSGCVNWMETNHQIYDTLVAGKNPFDTTQEADQFMQMWNYATQHAGAMAPAQHWDPGQLDNHSQNNPNQVVPNGAKVGPNGNLVFSQEKAETDFQPSTKPVDVLSDEFTLNIPEKIKGGVTVEKSTDTRYNPATPIYKITVTDQNSVPAVTTYFVNSEAKININTVGGKGVDLKEQQTFDSVVTVGTYKAPSKKDDSSSNPPASKEGTLNETTKETEYVGQGSEKIDFFAQPLAEDGQARTSKIWANANIVVPGGCHAEVQVAKDSNGKVIETTITIKDKNGKTTDVYKVQKGFTVEIQANKEYVKFGSNAEGADKPEGFDKVTLSGTQSSDNVEEDDSDPTTPAGIVHALQEELDLTGKDKAFLNLLKDADPSLDFKDKAALIAAIKDGKFPPAKPDKNLLKMIIAMDSKLADKLALLQHKDTNTKANRDAANKELANILAILYPDSNVKAKPVGDDCSMNIHFGAKDYHWDIVQDGSVWEGSFL